MKSIEEISEGNLTLYEKLIQEHFYFLVERYGFSAPEVSRLNSSGVELKYLSGDTFIKFLYCSPSFELDFFLGRLNLEDKEGVEPFTSSDLVNTFDKDDGKSYRLYSAYSNNNLKKCIPKLSEILMDLGTGCLTGESYCYEHMLFNRKQRIYSWCKEQELKRARREAVKAWSEKDYSEYVSLLKDFVNELSSSEIKKIEYARKKTEI